MTTLPESFCSVDGCDKPTFARGLCTTHWRISRNEHAPRCRVMGCEKPSEVKGLCRMHDARLRKTGSLDRTPPPEQPGPSGERWRAVEGYKGLYEVSNFGRVKSIGVRPGTRYAPGYILKTTTSKFGYIRVTLSDHGSRIMLMHILVARAFVPNPEEKPQVNHRNGVKGDNRATNLEWMTASENTHHGFTALGRQPLRGARHPMARWTREQVLAIRAEHALGGRTYAEVGAKFGMSEDYVGCIVRRSVWKHV